VSQLVIGMDTSPLGWLGGSLTGLFLACFVGWAWYAYNPANRAHHEAASRLPLEGDDR